MEKDGKGEAWKAKIPKKFYTRDGCKASTVGALIERLQELPASMKINEPVRVVVFNIDYDNRHVSIREDW